MAGLLLRGARRLVHPLVTGVALLVTLLAGSALVLAVGLPAVSGAVPYAVVTGSMTPTIAPGALVVVRDVGTGSIGVGDVITYQVASDRPDVVTHRVVAQTVGPDGRTWLRTQGDANPVPDAAWVRPEQVRGKVWYSVPLLGRLSLLLDHQQRRLAALGAATWLFGYAAVTLVRAWRHPRPRRRTAALPVGLHRAG
ncbi:signal peptidase I [Nocardioides sp. GY 10127]|uniref:signal peptidase I n=1 Tax=Nocardioides sp. GY 10127 TaxID=2569762 RepID=UPI0010A82FB6|nr:signal peptidase I [Nocardioides sp. GY 10127]TIC85516.1 signal peptidase I [Nocardioides sp. GY 10127]